MKFTQEHDDGTRITVEISPHSTLDETVVAFTDFLRGCGYHVPYNAHLDFVYEDDNDNKAWTNSF